MRLRTVFVRFYKSFNYDYLRRYREKAKQFPWEDVEGRWYPFVRIPIDPLVTTVVGANESGKTHLLTAVEKGISGEGIERGDFCRYSHFFTVEEGKSRLPDFGFEWHQLAERDRAVFPQVGVELAPTVQSILSFRRGAEWDIYIPGGSPFTKHTLRGEQAESFTKALPYVFRINPEVALPDSVPIRFLAGSKDSATQIEAFSRSDRFRVWEAVEPLTAGWTPESANAPQTVNAVTPALMKAWIGARRHDDSNGTQSAARVMNGTGASMPSTRLPSRWT